MDIKLRELLNKGLLDFYNNNKSDDRIYSDNQITSFSFKMTPYRQLRSKGNTYLKENKSDIIFGLKSGIVFTKSNIIVLDGVEFTIPLIIELDEINSLEIKENQKEKNKIYLWVGNYLTFNGIKKVEGNQLWKYELDLIEEIKNLLGSIIEKYNKTLNDEFVKSEKVRLSKLKITQNNLLSQLDKDGNGEVDVVEGNDFNILLKKHQKSIVEVDRNYVQQFVKVSSYLKTKKENIQSIFNSIKDTPNQEVLNEYVGVLKDEIHTYNLILFNSLNMIVSLVEDDMITFYEIHEMFDTLNMFDSKHEKDVSQKLINIGDGLESLMYEIRDMGNHISNSIDQLSYVTEESNRQLTNQLSEIDSTMKVGNLINTINTYQNYKNNKNTKSLRG
tara:strand:- start:710 stop:1873 length:1164 start_codon:yes stop_codon:yes gene_type:complete